MQDFPSVLLYGLSARLVKSVVGSPLKSSGRDCFKIYNWHNLTCERPKANMFWHIHGNYYILITGRSVETSDADEQSWMRPIPEIKVQNISSECLKLLEYLSDPVQFMSWLWYEEMSSFLLTKILRHCLQVLVDQRLGIVECRFTVATVSESDPTRLTGWKM